MFGNSRVVESSQCGPHARLGEVARRHLGASFRREPSVAGRAAFDSVVERLREPFVLDAGCGTGASTLALARAFPDRVVLGVDKSMARMGRGVRLLASLPDAPGNCILLRCDLVDFWQLAAAVRLRCERQFLLYPNPWPKRELLTRRWHAHPVLPAVLALGGVIELRTNWKVYADEFAVSMRLAGRQATCAPLLPNEPLTPFERKYACSGHALWRCVSE